MDEKKLTAKEKVGIYCLMLLIRWMIPSNKMDEDMQKLVADITHQTRCNL